MYLYLDTGSWLHRCHPVVRLAVALALFAAAFMANTPQAQAPLLVVLAALVVSTGAIPNIVRLRHLFAVVAVMTFAIWLVFYRGEVDRVVLELGPLVVSEAAVRFAITMAMKLTAFLASGTIFLTATRVEEFAYALTALGVPYRFGFAVTLSFRLVPVFLESAQRVVEAQRCRGFDFDRGGLFEKARRYVPVMVPVFMGALRRTDGLAMALDARGFQLERAPTRFLHYPLGMVDAIAVLAASLLVVLYALV